jgi:Holliday junction resolvase RusA-like endonuclease
MTIFHSNELLFSIVFEGDAVGVNRKYINRRYTLNPKYRGFKESIGLLSSREAKGSPIQDDLYLDIRMHISRAKDADACLKPLFDGLQLGRLIGNDRQIRGYEVIKTHKKRGTRDILICIGYRFQINDNAPMTATEILYNSEN